MKATRAQELILLSIALGVPGCNKYGQSPPVQARKITFSTVQSKAATVTRQYACQIHARRIMDIRALQNGYVGTFKVKEGQTVKKGDLLFEVEPLITRDTPSRDAVSTNPKVSVAKVVAQFDGIVDRVVGSRSTLVDEGDILMTLTDTSLIWAFFNVPEIQYLEYMANWKQGKEDSEVELVLANGEKFSESGKIGAIEAQFNNGTGTIPVRADFPNPKRLLRHGETGTVVINRVMKDAIVIPQRATFENSNKRYVYVVDKENVAHQREIIIKTKIEDSFIIKEGVGVGEKIVLEGVKLVLDGDKVE
jgi:membrane fusion protein, multidrug efflux system